MKKNLILLMMSLLVPLCGWAEDEAYAVLSDDGLTVTFYYDGQKESRGGVELRGSNYSSVTTAVFDDSFSKYEPTSTASMFEDCSSLVSIIDMKNLKTDNVTDMNRMFRICSSLTSLDVSEFKTNNVKNMRLMFAGCFSLTSLDVSNFNTSNVTDMGGMFNYCPKLTSLDVSNFNTSNVTNMESMFSFCFSLTDLDLSGFKTDNVTTMGGMFQLCIGLKSLDLSGFNTNNVMYMYTMFAGCSALTSIDLSGFKTDNVTYTELMFAGCSSLSSLDLSSFKTDNVTNMDQMFNECNNLRGIYVSEDNWSTANVTNGSEMFTGCTNLVGGNGTKYDNKHVDYTYARIDSGADAPGYLTDVRMKKAELVPVDEGDYTDYGEDSDITEETDLTGTVVDNMYYSIGTNAGGYSSEEGCIIITQETSDEQMELVKDLGISDEELNQNFTGIIFKVPAGSGKVTVNAETTGNMTLKVKVGGSETVEMELEGKLKMKFPYSVKEESLVYIFAGTIDKSTTRGASNATESSLKIYGIELELYGLKGDANGDGVVNAADIVEVVNYTKGKPSESFNEKLADANGDGKVNATDIDAIAKIIMTE